MDLDRSSCICYPNFTIRIQYRGGLLAVVEQPEADRNRADCEQEIVLCFIQRELNFHFPGFLHKIEHYYAIHKQKLANASFAQP